MGNEMSLEQLLAIVDSVKDEPITKKNNESASKPGSKSRKIKIPKEAIAFALQKKAEKAEIENRLAVRIFAASQLANQEEAEIFCLYKILGNSKSFYHAIATKGYDMAIVNGIVAKADRDSNWNPSRNLAF